MINYQFISNFINEKEKEEILSFQFPAKKEIDNEHIRKINADIYGSSVLYDFSENEITKIISEFQGGTTKIDSMPDIYHQLMTRIADKLSLPTENTFFQYIKVGACGKVSSHYDAGLPNLITYKCNIYVDGPDDVMLIDKEEYPLKSGDLYCFEANLFKHSIAAKEAQRTHLSYAFIVPCSFFGWSEDDPRIRLSNRIYNYFIASKLAQRGS